MWKYTHTDEMYHSLTGCNNELFHSDIYLGQDFSDGIKHFKYIKREKVNGKWRYYYRDEKLEKKKNERDTELEALQYENKKRGYGDDNKYHLIEEGKKIDDPVYKKLGKDAGRASFDYARAEYKSNKRKKKYDPAVKGLNALSDASYDVKKRIEKGKKTLEDFMKNVNKNKKKKKKQLYYH